MAMSISRRDAIRLSGAGMMALSVGRLAPSLGLEAAAGEPWRGPVDDNGKPDTLSRQLCRFVINTKFEELPGPVVEAWKTVTLDSIGIAFVGSKDRLTTCLSTVAHKLGGDAQCTVINSNYRTDVARAAWLNGTLMGTPQSDSPSNAHAASNVVPAIMAISEREHLSGKAFLSALILGGDVGGRIEAASVGVETKRGFHNPAVQGPFSAAAAVGKLLNFDENTMVNALGIAGSSSAGLQEFAFEGADMKATHAGRASQLGLESALLAAAGVIGPTTVLEGPFGYFNGFSLPTDPQKTVVNLNVNALKFPGYKPFAVHSNHQQIVGTIVEFKKAHPEFKAENVKHVTLKGPEGAMESRHVVLEPTTVMGGKYSTPFATSVALFRDLMDPLNFDEAAVKDPKIRELAKNTELIVANDVGDRAHGGNCEITLEMNDGQKFVLPTKAPKGSGRDPYTFDECEEKFRRWTKRVIGEKQQTEIVNYIRGLVDVKDMAAVVKATAART